MVIYFPRFYVEKTLRTLHGCGENDHQRTALRIMGVEKEKANEDIGHFVDYDVLGGGGL